MKYRINEYLTMDGSASFQTMEKIRKSNGKPVELSKGPRKWKARRWSNKRVIV